MIIKLKIREQCKCRRCKYRIIHPTLSPQPSVPPLDPLKWYLILTITIKIFIICFVPILCHMNILLGFLQCSSCFVNYFLIFFLVFFISTYSNNKRTEQKKTEIGCNKESRFHKHSWFVKRIGDNYLFFMFFHNIFTSNRKYWSSSIKVRVQKSKTSRPRLCGLIGYVHFDVRTSLGQHNLYVRYHDIDKNDFCVSTQS